MGTDLKIRLKVAATHVLKSVEKYAKIGADITEAVNDLKSNRKLFNVLHVALSSVKAVHEHVNFYDDDPSWSFVSNVGGVYHDAIREHMLWAATQGMCRVTTSEFGDKKICLVSSDDIIMLLVDDDPTKMVLRPTAHDDKQYIEFIRKVFWMKNGTRLRMSETSTDGKYGRTGTFRIHPDPITQVFASKLAEEIAGRAKKFIANGIGRTLIMYGPPGTGKSNIAKYVAAAVNGLTVVTTLADMTYASEDDVAYVLQVLRPDVIIIDDIDRNFREMSQTLERFEKIKSSVGLLIVTANQISSLDQAMLRPGRLDDVILVTHLDEDVAKSIVGGCVDEQTFQDVKEWPAAFLNELKMRVTVLGDDPTHVIADLGKRVDASRKHYGFGKEEGED